MNKTKIPWCDCTINPVVGCPRDCPYCYARKLNARFKWIKDWSEPQFFPERLTEFYSKFIVSNLGVVKNIAKCYYDDNYGKIPLDDLLSVGSIGLIKFANETPNIEHFVTDGLTSASELKLLSGPICLAIRYEIEKYLTNIKKSR